MKKNLVKSLLLGCLIFVLAACGGKSSDKTTTKSSDGGELRIALSSSIATLDPISYTAVYESNIMRSIFDTLVTYNDDLTEIVPSLATSWKVSDDMKTYTFELRDDVKFQAGKYQDGRLMTATDVKYSLERSLNESSMNRIRNVKKITATSDTELTIELETPYAAFLAMLTDTGNAIVPKEEVEGWGDEFAQHPVGTGPYAFSKWVTDDYVKLVKNDDYWQAKPKLDSVKFTFITDTNMMGNALQSGDIDIATNISGQNVKLIKKNKSLTLSQSDGLSIGYLAFNMKSGPTKELKVRQAMSLALDRTELVNGVYKYGEATEAYLPLPKASWGYSKEVAQTVKDSSGPDISAAKALLKEAGYSDGFDIDLYVTEARVAAATIFQAQMEKIGINVSIKSVEWGTFSDTVASGKASMYIMGWSWYPDPDFFLYQMLDSNQIGALGNGGGYSNPKVDALLAQATSETSDQTKRTQIYEEALQLITADIPHLDLYDQDIIFGLSDKVTGFKPRADGTIVLVSDTTNVGLTE